jgi:hypothetical protein
MPIDQVAELLVRWRETGGAFGRGRVLREGIQLLSGLDADERRLLARSLAEQGAPDLAQRVEHRTGGTMSANQLRSVADGLLALEDHQVEQMATSLADPAERERLARRPVTDGLASSDDGPSSASDHQTRLDELPPPGGVVDRTGVEPEVSARQPARVEQPSTADGRRGDRMLRGHEPGSQDLGSQELGSQDLGSQDLGSQDLGTPDLVEAGLVDVQVHEPPADVGDPAPAATTAATAATAAAATADASQAATGVAAAGAGAGVRTGSTAAAARTDDRSAERERPAVMVADVAALLEALRTAGTATTRLRVLNDHELADMDADTALAVMDAIPDGWQRRRTAQRLAEAGALPVDRLVSVFARFARPADAAFVAGALVAAGHVRAAAFDGILPERVVRRLTVRSER